MRDLNPAELAIYFALLPEDVRSVLTLQGGQIESHFINGERCVDGDFAHLRVRREDGVEFTLRVDVRATRHPMGSQPTSALGRLERRLHDLTEWIYRVDAARNGTAPWKSPYVEEALGTLDRYAVTALVLDLLQDVFIHLREQERHG